MEILEIFLGKMKVYGNFLCIGIYVIYGICR